MFAKSLRFQLLAGLLVPLGIVALIELSVAFRTAEVTAQVVTDRLLLASARSMAEHIDFVDGLLEAVVPPSALGLFDLGYSDTVYYRVRGADGRLLAGYNDLPAPPVPAAGLQPSYSDSRYRGVAIRLVAVTQPVPSRSGMQEANVVVAETLNGRNAMSRQVWIGIAVEQFLLVAIACALAWIVLKRVLAPLLRLSREVRDREPNDFMPFTVAALQAELDPLVNALNWYMLRLRSQLDAQRRFTENAAHQLRTPLTLLRTQASFALRTSSEDERSAATRAILETTQQITRLTNQLLSLAKAERGGPTTRRDALDLALVARGILEEHGRLAVDRDIDLAFDVSTAEAALVRADPTMLRDLIVNLLDKPCRIFIEAFLFSSMTTGIADCPTEQALVFRATISNGTDAATRATSMHRSPMQRDHGCRLAARWRLQWRTPQRYSARSLWQTWFHKGRLPPAPQFRVRYGMQRRTIRTNDIAAS